ncbi:hypothetical protein [Chroococcidiopsis sp.]|uniref:hypothetical protein n=1 Tax=Chroococcidiopsis sp. TaxID=3088168 RepID=UPI003F3E111A
MQNSLKQTIDRKPIADQGKTIAIGTFDRLRTSSDRALSLAIALVLSFALSLAFTLVLLLVLSIKITNDRSRSGTRRRDRHWTYVLLIINTLSNSQYPS